MATILCFGDSNTWGMSPTGTRYNEEERWTALLAKMLVNKHTVIEAGQPNRTVGHNTPFSENELDHLLPAKSGIAYLKPYLIEHQPDLLLIMLGTNDLKKRFGLTAIEIGQGMLRFVKQIIDCDYGASSSRLKILVISPPPIFEVGAYVKIYAGATEKSKQLAKAYSDIAKTLGCAFFDAGTVVESCSVEGVHWHAGEHALFADAIEMELTKYL